MYPQGPKCLLNKDVRDVGTLPLKGLEVLEFIFYKLPLSYKGNWCKCFHCMPCSHPVLSYVAHSFLELFPLPFNHTRGLFLALL